MPYRELTGKGKSFIRSKCSGTGDSLISGNNGKLRYSNLPSNTVFTANARDENNVLITTNEELGEALIYWFNRYANEFNLDANILAAQSFQESSYRIWIYVNGNSSAQGVTQFLSGTIYDIIVKNGISYGLDQSDIDKITNGLTNPTLKNSYKYFGISNSELIISKTNRPILHQNCIDNPDIMIKAQCAYMNLIATRYAGGIAASTLFGYSRGQGNVKSNGYIDSVSYTKTKYDGLGKPFYYKEGVEYVNRIFNFLVDNFGYDSFDVITGTFLTS